MRAVIQMDYGPKDTREKQRTKITSNVIQVNVVLLPAPILLNMRMRMRKVRGV